MKWESVKSTFGYPVYTLWNNGRKLLTLAFNSSSNAARIEYAGEKRVFLVRKEGFLKNKIVLRNEYGVRLSYIGSENNGDFFNMNNERFFYSVEQTDHPSIIIYKETKDHPITICELNVDEKDTITNLSGTSLKSNIKSTLLMILGWYLFQPEKNATREKKLEYSLG